SRIRLGGRPTGVAAGPSGVWVAGHGRVWRINPRTGQVVATIAVADGLAAGGRVVVGRGAVWVGAWGRSAGAADRPAARPGGRPGGGRVRPGRRGRRPGDLGDDAGRAGRPR